MNEGDVKAARFERLYVFCMMNKPALVAEVQKNGGSFVKALAQAMIHADLGNLAKILYNWGDLLWPYYDALDEDVKKGLVLG